MTHKEACNLLEEMLEMTRVAGAIQGMAAINSSEETYSRLWNIADDLLESRNHIYAMTMEILDPVIQPEEVTNERTTPN